MNDILKEIQRYDDMINSEYMKRLKIKSIERWQLHYHTFMGHKFRLLKELNNDTKAL